MIKTVVTPQGCRHIQMTEQEIAQRNSEMAAYEAARLAKLNDPIPLMVEERLDALESEISLLKEGRL